MQNILMNTVLLSALLKRTSLLSQQRLRNSVGFLTLMS
jgi:hypothetical protein